LFIIYVILRTDIIYYYKHDREILIKYYETWTKSYALFYVSKTNKMTQKMCNQILNLEYIDLAHLLNTNFVSNIEKPSDWF
jgi:hypothetical protein